MCSVASMREFLSFILIVRCAQSSWQPACIITASKVGSQCWHGNVISFFEWWEQMINDPLCPLPFFLFMTSNLLASLPRCKTSTLKFLPFEMAVHPSLNFLLFIATTHSLESYSIGWHLRLCCRSRAESLPPSHAWNIWFGSICVTEVSHEQQGAGGHIPLHLPFSWKAHISFEGFAQTPHHPFFSVPMGSPHLLFLHTKNSDFPN